ncbi:MAG: hypothetical protein J6W24_06710 [Prevotella sp.]|nr:hypothetical protein [Prevotella sp.]
MNKIKNNTLVAVLGFGLLTSMFTSCEVNEQLCEKEIDGEHAHRSGVQFNYVWDKMPAAVSVLPVNTYIIADRVINTMTTSFMYNVVAESGHYLGDLPKGMAEEDNHDITTFQLPSGEYKFLTMSFNRTFEEKLDPSRIVTEDYVITPNPLKMDPSQLNLRLGQFKAEHRTYTYDELKDYYVDSPFGEFDGSVDNNPYTSASDDASEEEKEAKRAKFIRNITEPLVIDSTTIRRIGTDEVTEIEFNPTTVTQNIDLYFDLKKKQTSSFQFFVSDVWCVLSGIPRSMNIGTGAVDITQTDKLIFRTKLVDPTKVPDANSEELKPQGWPSERIEDNIGRYDNQAEDIVRCYANLNIPGIVENSDYTDANKYAGPGVLQIIVKVWVYEKNVNENKWGWRSRTIMGRVNLHKNIERAQLLELYNEKHNVEYWRKAQDYKSVPLAIDATLTQSLITGADESPRVANWEEEQHIEQEY